MKTLQAEASKPEETLSKRVIIGGGWISFSKFFSQFLLLIRLIVIARILSPSDFGLMGIAMLVISAVQAFSQTGIQQALIQKKENIEEYLNIAWTVLFLRGILLFFVIIITAPIVCLFFKIPSATAMIQVVGVSFLINSMTNIFTIYFLRDLEFKKQFVYELSGILAEFIFTVILAITMRNVWALVFGLLAGDFVRCVASFMIRPYRPRFRFNLEKSRELFRYGRWISGSSILVFMGNYVDNLCIGKILGATHLGFYRMAYNISNMPITQISYVVGRVMFPAYSKIQSNIKKIHQAHFQTVKITTILSAPISIIIAMLASDFTQLVLGDKWFPMVPAMQMLAIAGLLKSVVSTGSPLFYGTGHPKFEFYTQLIRALIILLTIYPLISYLGIFGAAVCLVLSTIGMLFAWYWFSQIITKSSSTDFIKNLGPVFLSMIMMACSIYISKFYLASIQLSYMLSLAVFFGIAMLSIFTYMAAIFIFQYLFFSFDITSDIKLVYKSFTGN